MSTNDAPESAVDFDRIRAALVAPVPVRARTSACEAICFENENIGKLVVEWCKKHGGWSGQRGHVDGRVFSIGVKVGGHQTDTAFPGDWIVRDHWGHFEVLTSKEFDATYEPIA